MKHFLNSLCAGLLLWQPIAVQAQDECCDETNRYWVGAEYLFWKIKNSPDPTPLLVTAPFAFNHAPLLDLPGTEVVLGDESVNNKWRSGGRFTLGVWCDDAHCYGAEVNYFFLPRGSKKETVSSNGLPGSIFLSVPFFDTTTNSESSSPVAVPGLFAGKVKLNVVNQMQGVELNGFATLFSDCAYKLDMLVGFRYWNFDERLEMFVDSPNLTIPGEIYQVKDHFHTKNNFYSGQIGASVDYYFCDGFFLQAKAKVALGAMREQLYIKGEFITNNFDGIGAPQTFEGGYFALPSNIGERKHWCSPEQ